MPIIDNLKNQNFLCWKNVFLYIATKGGALLSKEFYADKNHQNICRKINKNSFSFYEKVVFSEVKNKAKRKSRMFSSVHVEQGVEILKQLNSQKLQLQLNTLNTITQLKTVWIPLDSHSNNHQKEISQSIIIPIIFMVRVVCL